MSGINFLSDNYINDATLSITTGSANAQFPLSNLKNDSTTKKFRSTGNTVVIVLDLLQTRNIDTFAVVGDSTTGLEITAMSVKTSTTLDFSLATPVAITLNAEYNIGYAFISSVSKRYVQISFTGNGSYCEVSNVFVGAKLNLPLNSYSISSFRYGHSDRSSISSNDYGQKFIDSRNLQKSISGTLEFCTQAEVDELDTMFMAHGLTSPLWVILDPDSEAMTDGAYKLAMYGYMSSMPVWSAAGGRLFSASVEMDQVI